MRLKKQRIPRIFIILLIALIHIAIFFLLHPYFWNGDRGFLGWDAVHQAWGDLVGIKNILAAGEIPLWSPYEKMGYPIAFDPEVAHLYPLHWLLYLLMSLFGDGYWIVLVKVLLHYSIAAIGMQLYLRRFNLSASACWFGSISYIFSTRLAKSKDQAVLGAGIWLPWMLIAIDEIIKKPSWRSALFLGTIVGVDLLSGYPPLFARNLIILVPYFFAQLIGHLTDLDNRKRYLIYLTKLLSLSVIVTIGLSLPSLVAISDFSDTARASMSLAEVLTSKYGFHNIVRLIVPALTINYRAFFLYIGLLPIIFALYALINSKQKIRLLWVSLALFSIFLAFGSHSFVLPFMIKLFGPLFSSWRVPELYLFQAAFFLSALGALGLSEFQRKHVVFKINAYWIALVAFFIATICYFRLIDNVPQSSSQLHGALSSLLISLVSLIALYTLERFPIRFFSKSHTSYAFILLLLVDLYFVARPIYKIRSFHPNTANDALIDKYPTIKNETRLAEQYYFLYRVGLRKNVREFFGRNTALISKRFETYEANARHSSNLLASANVELITSRIKLSTFNQKRDELESLNNGLYRIKNHAPWAYFTSSVEILPTLKDILSQMEISTPGKKAFIFSEDIDNSLQKDLKTLKSTSSSLSNLEPKIEQDHFSNNRIALSVFCPSDGVLVLHEVFHQGWTLKVDGKKHSHFATNYLFRGIILKKGNHRIDMRFRPQAYLFALTLYFITFMVIILAFGFILYRYLKPKKQQNPRKKESQS